MKIFNAMAMFLLSAAFAGCITLPGRQKIEPLQESVIRTGNTAHKIMVITIDGIITDQAKTDFTGNELETSLVSRVKEELNCARSDNSVRAILLRIDSPGGSVTPCDIIYNEIVKFKKERGCPIIVEMGDIAASGGVYISAAGDKIIAHPTTVTGSIGVIAQIMTAKDLFDKIGLKSETIKSGEKKDMGSPFRPLTEDERAIFQDVINTMYERFLSVILSGRKNLSEGKLRSFADGRIFTSKKALEYGLIDAIGYTDDAISMTEQFAGLSNPSIITFSRPGKYINNIYSSSAVQDHGFLNILTSNASFLESRMGARFMYIMQP